MVASTTLLQPSPIHQKQYKYRRIHRTCFQVHATSAATAKPIQQCKLELQQSLEGLNRGVFGVKAAQLEQIKGLLEELEQQNPTPEPTQRLEQVNGDWKLLFSTIAIKGSRRTKLGLREIITLGDFIQTIDTENNTAVNKVGFSVRGLSLIEGALTIIAAYQVATPSRVDISFSSASLVPDQLERLFQKNYDLLLAIFNPEGWLEITYLDETHRIGRDDRGNVFYLERC